MDLSDQLRALAARLPSQLGHINTEEATKHALVMPFIASLGYNVFDPTEVIPEYNAGFGMKQSEKADYAIMKDGKPIMIFECKSANVLLGDPFKTQLHRYFTTTDSVRIGILTNGVIYEFYADLDAPNKMDQRPFLVIDMRDLQQSSIVELKRMVKGSFDQDAILAAAGELKYTRELLKELEMQFSEPSEEFLRFLVSRVYSGRLTERARSEFSPIVRKALRLFLTEQVNQRLRSAIEAEPANQVAPTPDQVDTAQGAEQSNESEVSTSLVELQAYLTIKVILHGVVDPSRVTLRDQKSYCSVLLDNNNRKSIARLHLERSKWAISLFDSEGGKEDIVAIATLDDLFGLSDRIVASARRLV